MYMEVRRTDEFKVVENIRQGGVNVLLVKQHVLHRHLADLDVIREQQPVDGLGGVGHVHAALERRLQRNTEQRRADSGTKQHDNIDPRCS